MMKTVTVQYFAAYREAVGHAEEQVETTAATADALFEQLQAMHPSLERFEAMRVAINDAMAGWPDAIADGDTVLVFPPVAGG
ncbi:MAG: MoaD/ThiS family protein [Pseudomonadota bacterium]